MKLFGVLEYMAWLPVTMRNEKRFITKGKKSKNTLTATSISYVIQKNKQLLELIKLLSKCIILFV